MNIGNLPTLVGERFKLKFDIEANELIEIAEAMGIISDDILVKATPNGLSSTMVNVGNFLMGELAVNKDRFLNFEAEYTDLAVDLLRLRSYLNGLTDNNDEDVWVNAEYNPITYELKLTSNYLSTTQNEYQPTKIRAQQKHLNLDLPGKAILKTESVVRAIRTMDNAITDYNSEDASFIKFGIKSQYLPDNKPMFYIETEYGVEEKPDVIRLEIPCELCGSEESVASLVDVESSFTTDCIVNIMKIIKKCETVEISIGTKIPIRFKVTLPKSRAVIEYTVAPKIDGA